ncbi:MAG: hypothetical protein SGILL_002903 [Bacillariaceae sp.]
MAIGGFDTDVIPFFPKICTLPTDMDIAHEECSMLGISVPCLPNFNEETLAVLGPQLRGLHIWTTLATVFVGVVSLRGAGCKANYFYAWNHSMAICTGWFAVFTGFFALFRFFWGVSRPLLVVGVLHNLAECWIISHLTAGCTQSKDPKPRRVLQSRLTVSIVLETSLVCLGIINPSLRYGFGTVQALGIMLDIGKCIVCGMTIFSFPILYISKWFNSEDPEVSAFYLFPALGHGIHLFLTILPLAFTIFFSTNASWFMDVMVEGLIHVSVVVTHILWCAWAWRDFDPKAWTVVNEETGEANFELPEKYQLEKNHVKKIFLLSLAIGAIFFGSAPLVLGPCDGDDTVCFQLEKAVSGTSTAKIKQHGLQLAFEDLVASENLVEKARKAPGNMYYHLIQDIYDPSRYQILEQWSSMAAFNAWEESAEAKAVFASPELRLLIEDGEFLRKGPFMDLPPPFCQTSNHASAQTFDVKNTCAGVWEIIEREGACFWIPGCDYASARTSRRTPPFLGRHAHLHTLEMDNGRLIKAQRYDGADEASVTYKIMDQDKLHGFIGTLSTSKGYSSGNNGGEVCTIRYEYSVPPDDEDGPRTQLSIAYIHDAFQSMIPSLQRKLAKGGTESFKSTNPQKLLLTA